MTANQRACALGRPYFRGLFYFATYGLYKEISLLDLSITNEIKQL